MKHYAIGVRLPKNLLVRVERLSRETHEARSAMIRKLVMVGYADVVKEQAADKYRRGTLSLSEAAHQADLTVWELERYLVERGYQSSYSVEDLARER